MLSSTLHDIMFLWRWLLSTVAIVTWHVQVVQKKKRNILDILSIKLIFEYIVISLISVFHNIFLSNYWWRNKPVYAFSQKTIITKILDSYPETLILFLFQYLQWFCQKQYILKLSAHALIFSKVQQESKIIF